MPDAHTDAHESPGGVEVGQLIAERYRVVDAIGRGGMGTIWEVEHVTTGKRLALKTLLPGFGRIGEIARRFEREARAASLLQHPNVVSVTDFGELPDGALYLVMELVRGRSLGDMLDEGALAVPRALHLARQVLEALAHAHKNGIIHRDLKPDNVMVLDAGESAEERDLVKLLDFGIAKVVGGAEAELGGEKLTQAGIAFGTPDYMAPEQALGEIVDGRADLYAMGVILFEALAGRKPFVSADKVAVLRMHVAVSPPSLADAAGRRFTPGLERVVAKALEKRRDDRFASAEEMIAALDAAAHELLSGVEVPAEPAIPAASAEAAPAPTVAAAPSVASLAELRRARPFLVRLAVIGLPLLMLVVVVILLAAGAFSGRKAPPIAGGGLAAEAAPPPKSELARRAEGLLESGDAAGVAALLDAELASAAGQKDAWAHLFLGHARVRLGRDREALVAYERALELAPALDDDPELTANAEAILGKKDKTAALAAVDLLSRLGDRGRAIVVEVASSGKVREVRQRARAAAERDGTIDRVDRVESYSLDLHQGATCRERHAAVAPLRALRDKRAIAALKRAANRSGGILGLEDVNSCLARDAREAVEFLEALP